MKQAPKLGFNLLRSPRLITTIAPYARHPLRSNWDVGEPWWNHRAMQYVKARLPASGEAFEWGSGGSTVWLAAQGLHVTSIESDSKWAERVSRRCSSADVRYIPGADTGTLRSEPQLDDEGRHFFDAYVSAIDDVAPRSLDIVVIDGICRVQCARRTSDKVKPNGMVVLDDTNWDFLRLDESIFAGWQTVRLRGFKRMDGCVWETTCFLRPA